MYLSNIKHVPLIKTAFNPLIAKSSQYALILGEMQRIAFHQMLSLCVCVCVYTAFVDDRKQFEIATSFFRWIVHDDSAYQLYKFDTNSITNSKMADKMAAVKHYNWL